MTEVQGRTAFVTGGANGIGLGIARALAKAGAKIVLADIDEGALEEARAELAPITDVRAVILDVRDREAYDRVADAVEAELGPVSLLFNNAGVGGGAPAGELTYELWDWVIGINLYGVINGVQTFLPRIARRGEGGHIVNTASGAGLVASGSATLYCTSKFGVVGMSEAMHPELAAEGIGVSVLCPGPVATGIVRRSAAWAPTVAEGEERIDALTQWLGRGATIDAVGERVLKAVRDNSLYIHTDTMMAEGMAARTRALLDAMPA